MAIRTMIRGLVEALGASPRIPLRAGLAFGAVLLLISSFAAADYAAGLAAFNRKEYARAFSEWIEGAKAGDAHAQHGIGMLYELGQGVPHADPKAAAEWYQKAAEQEYAPAINNLARLFADGRGVKRDVPRAIELWSSAAEAGNITARFNLGLQYAAGSGVPKDMKKAAGHMLLAAESGLPEAQFALAGYYREGSGVEQDMAAARLWYERAASAGFEPARTELAALDEPAATPSPTVPAAAPAQDQQADDPETPPVQPDTDGPQTAQQAPGPAPSAQQAAITPPAEEAAQPGVPPSFETPAEEAATQQPTVGDDAAQVAQEQPEESAAGAEDPPSDLPVAESMTGDGQVYRIWLYTSGQEGDARSYWDKLAIQYPRLLKALQLDLRRYFLGEARGSLYRVFAGPFDDLEAAQKACEDLRQRSGDQFCRPVLN